MVNFCLLKSGGFYEKHAAATWDEGTIPALPLRAEFTYSQPVPSTPRFFRCFLSGFPPAYKKNNFVCFFPKTAMCPVPFTLISLSANECKS